MKKFEFIEHTADIAIKVYGHSHAEIFQNSAEAMFSILLDYKPKKNLEKNIILEAVNLEDLLVIWLNELLSLFYADKFLPASFSIKLENKNTMKFLKVKLLGQSFDPYGNKMNTEIKAATYHNLKIKKEGSIYLTEVIFDV